MLNKPEELFAPIEAPGQSNEALNASGSAILGFLAPVPVPAPLLSTKEMFKKFI